MRPKEPLIATTSAARDAQDDTIIRVAVPVPLAQAFDYSVPSDMAFVAVGARVRVPFHGRTVVGICLARDPRDAHRDPKAVLEVVDQEPVFGPDLLALAHWMADYYLHPIGEVLAAMLPSLARRGAPLSIRRAETWVPTDAEADLKRAPRQAELLAAVRAQGPLTTAALNELGFSRAIINALAAKGLLRKADDDLDESAPRPARAITQGPLLTNEQAAVVEALQRQDDGFAPTLIDGVTGSGKTEIYLRRIEVVLAAARQALVLVPEIALTPQTVARFEDRFGTDGVVVALHSQLTDSERMQAWLRCRGGQARVVIGTRSAVLAPFRDLGLIVVDEEHDGSFKQTDGLRYSARDVAVKRAQTLGIPLLLGSATPALESLHNAHRGRYAHVRLTQRAGDAQMPRFELLDIRGHTLEHGVSPALMHLLEAHLSNHHQVLVFLNRRGYAPSFLCASCGWQAKCAGCDMPLTLHRQPEALVCHHCGRREAVPKDCGNCGRPSLMAVGVGTQRTEFGLAQRFPGVSLIRIDRDTTRSQRQLTTQLEQVHEGGPAILLGTQMLAKGHHFPRVTLVAVINADAGFLSADFRAPERTAQLITQVAGRAGRAQAPGQVCIQTYQPDNSLLRSLIEHGYAGFAERELQVRQATGMPPFRPMAMLRAESASAAAAQQFLQVLARNLVGNLEVLGPAPAPVAKIADRYRYQLMLLADNRKQLHHRLGNLRASTAATNSRVRWSLDIDPYDTF